MIRVLAFLALLWGGAASAQCVGPLQANNNLSDVCNRATALTNLGPINSQIVADIGTVATATSTASPSAKLLFKRSTTIAASTTPGVSCGTNPGGTMTLVWKKNGSTLCTMSLSTSCVVSSCSLSATTFAADDILTIESTADATVTGLTFGVPVTVAQ